MIPTESMTKILVDLILATAAIILVKRDILSLISAYTMQSALLAAMSVVLYIENGASTLIYVAAITLVSKVIVIPAFMRRIQEKIKIKRDVEFRFLSPITALFTSIFIILLVYASMSRILAELAISSLFFLGATAGVSLAFMGMIVILSRKQTITGIVGYLMMENGVLLFSIFLTELPLIIEFLIVLDLIILTLMATILAFGINSTIEEFHARLNVFQRIAPEDDKE